MKTKEELIKEIKEIQNEKVKIIKESDKLSNSLQEKIRALSELEIEETLKDKLDRVVIVNKENYRRIGTIKQVIISNKKLYFLEYPLTFGKQLISIIKESTPLNFYEDYKIEEAPQYLIELRQLLIDKLNENTNQ